MDRTIYDAAAVNKRFYKIMIILGGRIRNDIAIS